ncbi:unnamed protein product [Prorocentrum cordatum]|uniref:Uncharacterized protein n=1 Tax=Prorocentrum cordatum TaxID=2364126 RepID=A0ABN9QAS9_9DINO|nr:unnamed protein product [Polarella glacialis]
MANVAERGVEEAGPAEASWHERWQSIPSEGAQRATACRGIVSRVVPCMRSEAQQHEDVVEPPADKNQHKEYRRQGQARMLELGAMALAARHAGEQSQASSCEFRISVIKAALGQALPTGKQVAECRSRRGGIAQKLANTRARIEQLSEQEADCVSELSRMHELIGELEEVFQEEMGGVTMAGPTACGAAAQSGGAPVRQQPGMARAEGPLAGIPPPPPSFPSGGGFPSQQRPPPQVPQSASVERLAQMMEGMMYAMKLQGEQVSCLMAMQGLQPGVLPPPPTPPQQMPFDAHAEAMPPTPAAPAPVGGRATPVQAGGRGSRSCSPIPTEQMTPATPPAKHAPSTPVSTAVPCDDLEDVSPQPIDPALLAETRGVQEPEELMPGPTESVDAQAHGAAQVEPSPCGESQPRKDDAYSTDLLTHLLPPSAPKLISNYREILPAGPRETDGAARLELAAPGSPTRAETCADSGPCGSGGAARPMQFVDRMISGSMIFGFLAPQGAAMADLFAKTPEKLAVAAATAGMFFGVGTTVGPFIGSKLGGAKSFLASSIAFLVTAAWVQFGLSETLSTDSRKEFKLSSVNPLAFMALLKDKTLAMLAGVAMLQSFGDYVNVYDINNLYMIKVLGYDPPQIGNFAMSVGLSQIAGGWATGKLVKGIGLKSHVLFANLAWALGCVVLGTARSTPKLFAALAIWTFGHQRNNTVNVNMQTVGNAAGMGRGEIIAASGNLLAYVKIMLVGGCRSSTATSLPGLRRTGGTCLASRISSLPRSRLLLRQATPSRTRRCEVHRACCPWPLSCPICCGNCLNFVVLVCFFIGGRPR